MTTIHPSRPEGAPDDLAARLAEIQARLEALNEPSPLATVWDISHAQYALYMRAPEDLAYLLDGLAFAVAQRDKAREEVERLQSVETNLRRSAGILRDKLETAEAEQERLREVAAAAREFWEAELEATAEHVTNPNNEEAERRTWRRIGAARERLDAAVVALRALDEAQP